MRVLILTIAVLFAVRAEAVTPPGCFTLDSNPNFCYGGEIDTYYQNDNDNLNQYGFTVGSLVNDLKFILGERNTCTSNLNGCSAAYDSKASDLFRCNDAFNALYSDYTSCGAAFRTADLTVSSLKRQIKALKRKCGSRCR